MSSSDILHELKAFSNTGTVLYIAAHPDDENTRMISYLSKGRGLRTGYLSLTRGDGGQNLIGSELRELLGVIRTQELLEARKIDGGEQFFTRAVDFGYSKTAEETLRIWDKEQVLADMVRVIRQFRPDVLVTRFSPTFTGTHGHHIASAQLTLEAFALSGDPHAFPEQLDTLEPWQPKRVFWNSANWGRRDPPQGQLIQLDVGGYNPALGMSYGEVAALSRSMHKSQGFGALASRGEALEELELLAGSEVDTDLMDGIDTSWRRLPGGKAVEEAVEHAIADFNPGSPSESLSNLLAIRSTLLQMPPGDALVQRKLRDLDSIIFAAVGLHAETLVPNASVLPGEELSLTHRSIIRTDVPARWIGIVYPSIGEVVQLDISLPTNKEVAHEDRRHLPAEATLTHPYWLQEGGGSGMFAVADQRLVGRPENEPAFPVYFQFEIGGQQLSMETKPVEQIRDPVKGEVRHPLVVSSPVVLSFPEDLELFAPGSARMIVVEATAARAGLVGEISLYAPEGWSVIPASQGLSTERAGDHQRFEFTVRSSDEPSTAELYATATIEGRNWSRTKIVLDYDHIPLQTLQPLARTKVVAADVMMKGTRVGYIHGAGDAVPAALSRMGYQVRNLSPDTLTPADLSDLDAVILGIRAFNTQPHLVARMPVLLDFVHSGGNLIIQYNTNGGIDPSLISPYPLKLSRERVTDEAAAVHFLNPDHPVLAGPNRITEADFEGWVQERGLYFPSEWGPEFQPLLSWSDAGEPPVSGGLLVAPYGDGFYIYTGLSFFRQLPAGVPGAYRLFANLVSLGK